MWNRTAIWYERRHRPSLEVDRGKAWGVFRDPENDLRLLGNVRGKRVLELGCGAADWSIALAREGARAVGIDFSSERLKQARAGVSRAGAPVELVQASAESVPYPNRYFDVGLSDYGATTFTNPRRTIPEVGRVLRTGGIFVFAHASPFRSVAENYGTDRFQRRFVRDYFGLEVLRTPESVEYQLTYGEWIQLFESAGFRVDRLVEPRAPTSRQSTYLSKSGQRWATHWPVEAIWRLVKVRRSARTAARKSRRVRRSSATNS